MRQNADLTPSMIHSMSGGTAELTEVRRSTHEARHELLRVHGDKVGHVSLVAAPTMEKARKVAEQSAGDAFYDYDTYLDVDLDDEPDPTSPTDVKDYGEDVPYGDNPDDQTFSEIAAKIAEGPPPPSEDRGPVVWCDECVRERVQANYLQPRQLCRECQDFLDEQAA